MIYKDGDIDGIYITVLKDFVTIIKSDKVNEKFGLHLKSVNNFRMIDFIINFTLTKFKSIIIKKKTETALLYYSITPVVWKHIQIGMIQVL